MSESAKKSLVLSAIDMISPVTKKVERGQSELQEAFDATKKEAAEASKVLSKIKGYEAQQSAVLKAEAALKKHTNSYDAYKESLKKVEKPTADQIRKLSDLEYKVSASTLAFKAKERALESTSAVIRKAGFDTGNLAQAQDMLTKRSKEYRVELEKQRGALKEVARAQEERQKKADFISGGAGGLAATAGAGVLAASMAGIAEERTLSRVESTAQSKGIEGAGQLKDIAREIAASREGQGVSVQDLHQSMIMAMNSGATTAEEVEQRVLTDLKVYSSIDKDRMDFWEVSKQTARMSTLDGASAGETEAFAGALARNYHGVDPEDAFDSYTEVRARTDAAGLDSKDVQAFHLAMLKNNMTGGESASTLEAMAEWVTVGGSNASKDQEEAYARIGLDATQASKMAQDDLIGYMELVYSRMENLEAGDQIAISEQLFGSGFMTILKAMKSGDFRTMQSEVSNSDLMQQDLNSRFERSTQTAGSGYDAAMGALGRVATEIFDPLKDPFNTLMDSVAGGLNSFADAINKADESTVQVVAGLGAVAGGALAVKKVMGIFSAFKSLTTMKAQTVIVNGGMNGGTSDLLGKDKHRKGAAAGGMAKGGLLKGAGKLAMRAVPVLGTALLAYDAIDMISSLVTGKSAADNVKGFFSGDDDKEKEKKTPALVQGVKDSGLTLDATNIDPGQFENSYSGGVPLPKEFYEVSEKVTKAQSTQQVAFSVDITGKVEGLSEDGEQQLIERVSERIGDQAGVTMSPMYNRESYG